MKIEIEVSEADIADAAKKAVKDAVFSRVNSYSTQEEIRSGIRSAWNSAVSAEILKQVQDCDAIKSKVAEELERKIRQQLTAAMKATGKVP